MNLETIRTTLNSHPSKQIFIPVIHCLPSMDPLKQRDLALEEGADGVIYICHESGYEDGFLLTHIAKTPPEGLIGLNLLQSRDNELRMLMEDHRCETRERLNFLWTDLQPSPFGGTYAKLATLLKGLADLENPIPLAAGCTFKGQAMIGDSLLQAFSKQCQGSMDILTTSGPRTGVPASPERVAMIEKGDCLLALASGVSVENAKTFPNIDMFFVSSSIEFLNGIFDRHKVRDLAQCIHSA
jgi:hypothetical protein